MGTRVRGARLRGDRGKGGLRSEEDVEGSASRLGGYRRAGAGTSSSNTHACASVSPAVSSCVPIPTAPNAPPHAARASLSPATSPLAYRGVSGDVETSARHTPRVYRSSGRGGVNARCTDCRTAAGQGSVEREINGLDVLGEVTAKQMVRENLKQRLAPCSHWVGALRCRSATGWNMGERAEHWAMFLWG